MEKKLTGLDYVDKLKAVARWTDYEDCNVLDAARSVEDLIKMRDFLIEECDVEFSSSMYELIAEEEEFDGTSETRQKLDKFNQEVGYMLL